MPRSLKSLKDEIRSEIWPQSEAENLIAIHDNMFIDGLGQIQMDVRQLQDCQASVFQFGKTFFKNGMTVIPAPNGIVHRVYTIERARGGADYDWSRPVFYRDRPYWEVEAWSRNLRHHTKHRHSDTRHNLTFDTAVSTTSDGLSSVHRQRMNPVIPTMPLGFRHADKSTDTKFRARSGIYSIHDRNIYVGPWIQSDEMVVVEWSGIKPTTEWRDEDLVPDSPEFKRTLKLYVQWKHQADYGSDVTYRSELHGNFMDSISDLMIQQREQDRVRNEERMTHSHHHSFLDFNKILNPPKHHSDSSREEEFVIAHIGNNGMGTPQSEQVAYLVNLWKPDAVVASGGNTVKDANSTTYLTYDYAVGRLFSRSISPYYGVYPGDSAENRFWPAIDSADWANGSLASFLSFFKLPNNSRYYDFVVGEAHFFVIDADVSEPDGKVINSKQADWLRMMLALSTARWKIVVSAVAPYCSEPSKVDTDLRWDFDGWGADLVISGEAFCYERLSVSRFPYIVNGLGGKATVLPSAQDPNSIKMYASSFGAGKITITPTALRYQFFDVAGNLIDCFEIEKGKDMKCPVPGTANASNQILTGQFDNPNGNVTPQNPAQPATYYKDQANPLQCWLWSVQQQLWIAQITG